MVGAGLARIKWSSPKRYLQNLPLQVIYFLEIFLVGRAIAVVVVCIVETVAGAEEQAGNRKQGG